MDARTIERLAVASARRVRRAFVDDIERQRLDAGWSMTALARHSGVDPAYLHRILVGSAQPSLETCARLTAALGSDLALRAYPNTGPIVRDHLAAPMLERLVATAHVRWDRYPEVGVRHPSRGWIDLLLHDPLARIAVAAELQSQLQRLEQLIRWQSAKAAALPSWEGWDRLGEAPEISRLLVVRRTRATREVATTYAQQLRTAYPAHPDDAIAALAGTGRWPGSALAWMVVDARGARWAQGR